MAKKNCHLVHSLGSSMSFGMLSLKAKILWPMMIADADDQGRHNTLAKPIKWGVCQNVDEIAIEDIPALLEEMADQEMLLLYGPDNCYGQILNWWDHQPMNYARPSEYPAPDGWIDRIRYRKREDWHKEHWDCPGGFKPCTCDGSGNDTPNDYPIDTPDDSDKVKQSKATEGKEKVTDININSKATIDDADATPSLDILSRLECLGIKNPARNELAALAHVTVDYLESWRIWWQDGGAKKLDNPPGYLVKRIREGDVPE